MKRTLNIDDSLDVFPVHGAGGLLGTMLTGVSQEEENEGLDTVLHNEKGYNL